MAKTTYPVVFREKFLATLSTFDGSFRELCAGFGVSHETGYQWLRRFEERGREGLAPRPSVPLEVPHTTPLFVQELLIAARRSHPTWGPRKLKDLLEKTYPRATLPAASTIGDILKRAGLVRRRKRRPHAWPSPRPFAAMDAPNEVWTADFKGQFRTKDGKLCYPLTIADGATRYLIRCDGYAGPTDAVARTSFELAFREFGMPRIIHTDNGTPFASTAAGGLSRLSAWWVRLGIVPERSRPGKPCDNGRHERMHRTLKAETTKPARANLRAQQRVFDAFCREYNDIRPHEALGQTPPAALYVPSPRPYLTKLSELEYSDQHQLRRVDSSGHFKWHGQAVFLTGVLAGEVIGLWSDDDDVTEVFFGPVLLGTLSASRPDLGLCPPPRR
jgi:transposase InsO family protein